MRTVFYWNAILLLLWKSLKCFVCICFFLLTAKSIYVKEMGDQKSLAFIAFSICEYSMLSTSWVHEWLGVEYFIIYSFLVFVWANLSWTEPSSDFCSGEHNYHSTLLYVLRIIFIRKWDMALAISFPERPVSISVQAAIWIFRWKNTSCRVE